MKKVDEFAIYRTPFKFKFKSESKKTPVNQPSKQPCNNYEPDQNNLNTFTRSPYSIKYARNHQSAKAPRTVAEKDTNNEDRPISEMRLRLKSSPQR